MAEQFPPPQSPKGPGDVKARWGQERRLAFIDFRLQFEGRVNRGDLTNFFGISHQQASQDLARYQVLAPDNLRYDSSSKMYVAGDAFRPKYGDEQADRFLNDLFALSSDVIGRDSSFIGWLPPFGVVPTLNRPLSASLLAVVMSAMREQRTLKITYQSMSREHPSRRAINPHALGHDGFRWHVRAYCHDRRGFCDFVLGRILSLTSSDEPWIDAASDMQWHTWVVLDIAPNPSSSIAQQRVLALDYGMNDGHLRVECRQALLFYALKRLGLNDNSSADAASQHIVLLNRDEVLPYLRSNE